MRQVAFLFAALACLAMVSGEEGAEENSTGVNCVEGLLVPLWKPVDQLGMGDRSGSLYNY